MEVYNLLPWVLMIILLLLTNCFDVGYSSSIRICPSYCKCFKSHGMRSASCIGQRLPNIETGVPNNAQILDISNNSISALEYEGFKNLGLTSLYKLQLQHNHIGSIDLHAFSGVTELRILDLSYNHLYHLLPATFEDAPKLRSLYLQGNRLKMSSGPLLIIPTLEILDLSACQLDHFQHESFSKLPALKVLNLTQNLLIRLEVKVLETLVQLQRIGLNGNPWSCDGKVNELQVWLTKLQIQHDSICKLKNNNDKFQRIIVADVKKNDTNITSDDDLLKNWALDEREKNSYNKQNNENSCMRTNITISKSENIFKIFDKIPSFWSFMIGLEIGIVIGGFGMWLLFRIHKAKEQAPRCPITTSRGISLQTLQNRASLLRLRSAGEEDSTALWTELETINCPDTPPPAYRDCFDSLSRNNL